MASSIFKPSKLKPFLFIVNIAGTSLTLLNSSGSSKYFGSNVLGSFSFSNKLRFYRALISDSVSDWSTQSKTISIDRRAIYSKIKSLISCWTDRSCSCRSQIFSSSTIKNVPTKNILKIVNLRPAKSLIAIAWLLLLFCVTILWIVISEIPSILFETFKYNYFPIRAIGIELLPITYWYEIQISVIIKWSTDCPSLGSSW